MIAKALNRWLERYKSGMINCMKHLERETNKKIH